MHRRSAAIGGDRRLHRAELKNILEGEAIYAGLSVPSQFDMPASLKKRCNTPSIDNSVCGVDNRWCVTPFF